MHPYLEKEIEIHVDICKSILNNDQLSPKELMKQNLDRIIMLIGVCQELEKMIIESEIIAEKADEEEQEKVIVKAENNEEE